MKMARPIFVSPEGNELIIRVTPGTRIPSRLVGVEVHETYYRFVLEVPAEWVSMIRAAMGARGEIESL